MSTSGRGFVRCGTLIAAAVVAIAAAGALAQPAGGKGQPPGGRGEERGQAASLEGAMKLLNRGLRNASKQIETNAGKDAVLGSIWDAQRGAVAAKPFKPHHMPEKDQDAFLKDYRQHQVKLTRMLVDLEEAVLNDKMDDAKKLLKDLAAFKDASHKVFAPDEEDDHADEKK